MNNLIERIKKNYKFAYKQPDIPEVGKKGWDSYACKKCYSNVAGQHRTEHYISFHATKKDLKEYKALNNTKDKMYENRECWEND